jgi:AcrR family transcriptional regulator
MRRLVFCNENTVSSGGKIVHEKKLSRREEEKLRHRRAMLVGALELFSEKGYHNVSMHEIAGKSEFAIGTLYKFFKNKEDLYKSLVLEWADRCHQIFMQALEQGDDDGEKLQAYILTKGQVFSDNILMFRLYFAETRGASFNIMAGLDSEIREQYNVFLKKLAMVFENGMKKNRFNKIADPYHLAVSLESISNAFLFLWLEEPEREPYPEDPNQILDIIMKGLANR